MKIALGYSHIDVKAALRLLLWIHHLGGERLPLVVVSTKLASKSPYHAQIAELLSTRFANAEHRVCRTEDERGWPKSATHLFNESLRFCTGYDTLWLEPDAIPLRKGWFERIKQEYASAGKLFMGRLIPAGATHAEHMTGVAVYGAAWEDEVPGLGAPNDKATGAWDVDCSAQVVPLMHNTRLIQQRWLRFSEDRRVDPGILTREAVLFHQDKLGRLPFDLDPTFADAALTLRYPSVLLRGNAMRYFLNQKADAPLKVGGREFNFEVAVYIGGAKWGTIAVSDDEDVTLLESLALTGRIKEIPKSDYDIYESKKKSEPKPMNSFAFQNLTNVEPPKAPGNRDLAPPAATALASVSVDDVLTPKKSRRARG